MPSKSKSQSALMHGVANSPEFAKKVGIPQDVGKEFSRADRGRSIRALPKQFKKSGGRGR